MKLRLLAHAGAASTNAKLAPAIVERILPVDDPAADEPPVWSGAPAVRGSLSFSGLVSAAADVAKKALAALKRGALFYSTAAQHSFRPTPQRSNRVEEIFMPCSCTNTGVLCLAQEGRSRAQEGRSRAQEARSRAQEALQATRTRTARGRSCLRRLVPPTIALE